MIARGLGHLFLRRGALSAAAGVNSEEGAANQFAVNLLMPNGAIKIMISSGLSTTSELSNAFGVPASVMARRLIG